MKEDVRELISALLKNEMIDHVINIAKPTRKVKLLLNGGSVVEYDGKLAIEVLNYIYKVEYSKDKMPEIIDHYA